VRVPRPVAAARLPGGWVGTAWRARLADGSAVVVKQTPYPADAEVDGLAALAAAGVPTPGVRGHAGGTLVLEEVGGSADWPALGRAIAGMHAVTSERYGWHRDNFAGRFPQPNAWSRSWPEFFAERRVRCHLADPAVPADLRRRLERVGDLVGDLLPERPPAILTHGDLWRGNTVAGRWVIDPEVSFADRELDLAYMEMSEAHPLPPAFWRAYTELLPFPDGYLARRPVLQLHHRLLQVRHFGASQLPALEAALAALRW
jgi:fructosamine-3-kinase